MKFHFCQNDRNEIILDHFGLYHVNGYMKLTRHRVVDERKDTGVVRKLTKAAIFIATTMKKHI